jgi:hypothetical protein
MKRGHINSHCTDIQYGICQVIRVTALGGNRLRHGRIARTALAGRDTGWRVLLGAILATSLLRLADHLLTVTGRATAATTLLPGTRATAAPLPCGSRTGIGAGTAATAGKSRHRLDSDRRRQQPSYHSWETSREIHKCFAIESTYYYGITFSVLGKRTNHPKHNAHHDSDVFCC